MSNQNFSIFYHPLELKRLSEMVFVESGAFMMGADEKDDEASSWEKPPHKVSLNSFHIGKFPVTQALWKFVMGENENPSYFMGDDRPVERVSWNRIKDEFLLKLNEKTKHTLFKGYEYCLPTEAQWEFAARGGGKYSEKYNFKYAGSDKLNEVGWFDKNSHGETKRVGLKTPNLLGLYDMSGNVWEWCEDDWHSNYKNNPPLDGSAWIDSPRGTHRVVRGGSWGSNAQRCRATFRDYNTPADEYNHIGFRLALCRTASSVGVIQQSREQKRK